MRVLLVDDQPLFTVGMRHLLAAHGFEVVGTAADGLEALVKARLLHPDLIIMDIQMPGCDGLEATRRIKAELPDVKIVMLTVSADDQHLFEAIKSGASGYLLKSLGDVEFCELLSGLSRGEPPLAPGLATKILEEYARQANRAARPPVPAADGNGGLTARQVEILAMVAEGRTYKEIAAALYLSESTVKYHMAAILERLQMSHRSEAIAYAERSGLTGRTPRRNPDAA